MHYRTRLYVTNDRQCFYSILGCVTPTWQGFTHLICWSVVILFHNVDLVQKTEETQKNSAAQISQNLELHSRTLQLKIQPHYSLSDPAIVTRNGKFIYLEKNNFQATVDC